MARSLEQLSQSTGILKGEELRCLQRFCVHNHMRPKEHLRDDYGKLLGAGNVENLRRYFHSRVESFFLPGTLKASARSSAADELYRLRYGPTRITVYNVLLAYTIIRPKPRKQYLECAEWLVEAAKVPVDGKDLSGTTVMAHAISTHPYLDTVFADLMLQSGSPINDRNRYGYTAAHEFAVVLPSAEGWGVVRDKLVVALRWFLENKGNLDLRDGDGTTARHLLTPLKRFSRNIQLLLKSDPSEWERGRIIDVPRNQPCPCGSGHKFRRCCGKD
ncbi:MAG: hypothetical protein Q9195_006213 [Heterodermia aff. obscurata]